MSVSRSPRCDGNVKNLREPLRIVNLGGGEQRVQRVVGGDHETCKVREELPAVVEEDQEEVDGTNSAHHVHLRHAGLLLQVVEGGVLGELGLMSVFAVWGWGEER
jgi:hypothetical protein